MVTRSALQLRSRLAHLISSTTESVLNRYAEREVRVRVVSKMYDSRKVQLRSQLKCSNACISSGRGFRLGGVGQASACPEVMTNMPCDRVKRFTAVPYDYINGGGLPSGCQHHSSNLMYNT